MRIGDVNNQKFVGGILITLPMRGVIVEGDFFVKDTCFAGRAIIV
jgi:hypothetical protein